MKKFFTSGVVQWLILIAGAGILLYLKGCPGNASANLSCPERWRDLVEFFTGTWGIFVIPFAMTFVWNSYTRKLGIFLCILSCGYLGVFMHDVVVHLRGGRPWVPWNDEVLMVYFYCPKADSALPAFPLKESKFEMTASHVRRGRYCFQIKVPFEISNGHSNPPGLEFRARFYDEDGKLIWEMGERGAADKIDYWNRWWGGESIIDFGIYEAEKEIPLDRRIRIELEFTKGFNEFMRKYPGSHFRLKTDNHM